MQCGRVTTTQLTSPAYAEEAAKSLTADTEYANVCVSTQTGTALETLYRSRRKHRNGNNTPYLRQVVGVNDLRSARVGQPKTRPPTQRLVGWSKRWIVGWVTANLNSHWR